MSFNHSNTRRDIRNTVKRQRNIDSFDSDSSHPEINVHGVLRLNETVQNILKPQSPGHPEIEIHESVLGQGGKRSDSPAPADMIKGPVPNVRAVRADSDDSEMVADTSADILRIYADRTGRDTHASAGEYRRHFSHDSFADHLSQTSFSGQEARAGGEKLSPVLDVLFIGAKESPPAKPRACLAPETIRFLSQELGVSALFLASIATKKESFSLLSAGSAMLRQWNSNKPTDDSLEHVRGFLQLSRLLISKFPGLTPSTIYMWFQHNLIERRSIYIVFNCSATVKDKLVQWGTASHGSTALRLLRPMTVDFLIIDDAARSWSEAVSGAMGNLDRYEGLKASQDMEEHQASSGVFDLYTLSQHLHHVREELNAVVSDIDYLITVYTIVAKRWRKLRRSRIGEISEPTTSVDDSLFYLRSRTLTWEGWTRNMSERTNIRIDLWFKLNQQRDSSTNLRIADLTSKIATETQKDSSAMITIAALSLLFLPGTFIATIFSMVFFNVSTSGPETASSSARLSVAKDWWIYPAITIPLTIIVICVWNYWRLRRNREKIGALNEPLMPTYTSTSSFSRRVLALFLFA